MTLATKKGHEIWYMEC